MPLALDPLQTIWISLKSDEDRPENIRPAFQVRFLTARQRRQVREAINAAIAAASDEESQRLVLEAIKLGLAGWRNMTHSAAAAALEYDPEKLTEVLTDCELFELVGLLLEKTHLAEIDLKNSGSPSAWPTAAEPAANAPA